MNGGIKMESLHYLLMKTHAMFSKKILSRVSKIGLTSGQPKILEFLLKYQEADQKTIAAYCEIEPATVGSILLRMEEGGLVTRRQKNGNRRSLYVSLTQRGREAALCLQDIFRDVESEATCGITAEEEEMLRKLLEKLSSTMQTHTEKGERKENSDEQK